MKLPSVSELIYFKAKHITGYLGFLLILIFSFLVILSLLVFHYNRINNILESQLSTYSWMFSVGDKFQLIKSLNSLIQSNQMDSVSIYDIHGDKILQQGYQTSSSILEMKHIVLDKEGIFVRDEKQLNKRSGTQLGVIVAMYKISFLHFFVPLSFTFILVILLRISLIKQLKGIGDHIAKPIIQFSRMLDGITNQSDIDANYQEINKVHKSYLEMQEKLARSKAEEKSIEKAQTIAETASMIAHDLKGPLATFERILHLPASQIEFEKEHLKSALNRLYSMADSIKHADIESIVKPSLTCIDPFDIIKNCNPFASMRGIRIVGSGPVLKQISVDANKVNRALSNLIINSCEVAVEKVELSWAIEDQSLIFSVCDDGPGISQDIVEKLFEKNITFGKKDGTGLGLYFVKQVAMGHGGHTVYHRHENKTLFQMVLKDVVRNQRNSKNATTLDKKAVEVVHTPNIIVNLLDKKKQRHIIDKLQKILSEIKISNTLDIINPKTVIYSENDDVLFMDIPKGVKVIIPDSPESDEQIIKKIQRSVYS